MKEEIPRSKIGFLTCKKDNVDERNAEGIKKYQISSFKVKIEPNFNPEPSLA